MGIHPLARQMGLNAAMLGLNLPSRARRSAERLSGRRGAGGRGEGRKRSALVRGRVDRRQCVLVRSGSRSADSRPRRSEARRQGPVDHSTRNAGEVVADEKILRQLDIDDAHPYVVKSSDLGNVVVMLEASPTYLTQRMKLLESRLAGNQKMVLTASPTAEAEQWKSVAHIADVRLWLRPFETLDRRGHLDGPAVQSRLIALLRFSPCRRRRCTRGESSTSRASSPVTTAPSSSTRGSALEQELARSSAHEIEKMLFLRGKQDASYWSGLIAWQQGHYEAAADYFATRTLQARRTAQGEINSPWIFGAQYNLARTYEAAGETRKAVIVYERNVSSPSYFGDLLRARWLASSRKRRSPSRLPLVGVAVVLALLKSSFCKQ